MMTLLGEWGEGKRLRTDTKTRFLKLFLFCCSSYHCSPKFPSLLLRLSY